MFIVQAQGGIHYKLFLKMPPYSVLVCCLQTRVTKLGEMLSFWLLFKCLGDFLVEDMVCCVCFNNLEG
jgi:hypothetical protein